jgi:hypothetical protein
MITEIIPISSTKVRFQIIVSSGASVGAGVLVGLRVGFLVGLSVGEFVGNDVGIVGLPVGDLS